MFASNGFDILTEPEGLLANMVATAFNVGFGQKLPIFSDQQTGTTAGFVPNKAMTYFDVRQFVITLEPSGFAVAAFSFGALAARRFRRR